VFLLPWIITFIVGWTIFLLLADKNNLRSMLGGFAASIMATSTDYAGANWFSLYDFYDVIIPWGGCSFFYIFGVIFTIGTLFCQYYPQKIWLKIFHVLIMSLFFLGAETLLIRVGVAAYVNWNIWASLFMNILAFCTLSWLTEIFKLNKRVKYIKNI